MSEALLQVKQLKQYFFPNRHTVIKAVDGISFDIRPGEIFGLVGESGSGKSTTARSIMHIYTPTHGEILLQGKTISDPVVFRRERNHILQTMQMIFQDPVAALNPRMTIGESIEEPLLLQRLAASRAERRDRVAELLRLVGLDAGLAGQTPSELSGGQCQRVCIARALALSPSLLIADEPIASLDVSIQAQIINLIAALQKERGLACLLIAHDLTMVRQISDRIGVMYRGRLVELAEREELFCHPLHPYTKALLSAIPIPDPLAKRTRTIYAPAPMPPESVWVEATPGHFVLL